MADKKDIRNNETKDEDFSDLKVFDKSDAEGNEILDQSLSQRAFDLMYPKNIDGKDGYEHNNLRGAINTQRPNVVMPGQAPPAQHHRGDVTDPKHDHRLKENQTKDKEQADAKQRQQNEEQQEEMQERLYPDERNQKDEDPNADPQTQQTEEHRFISPSDPRKRVDHRASLYKQALNSWNQNSNEPMTGPTVAPKSPSDYHWGPSQRSAVPAAPAAAPAAAPTSTPHPDPRVAQIMAHPYAKQLLPTTGEITPEMVDVAHARMQQYNSLNPMQQRPTAQTAMQNNSNPLIRELSRKHLPMDRKASKEELTGFHKVAKDLLKVAKDSREKNSFQQIASIVASLILQ